MPIMQTVIQGGGTTPTGTINITANGTYDVTDKASASVAVPTTAPAHYVEYTKNSSELSSGSLTPINLQGISTFTSAYMFAYACYGSHYQTVGFTNANSLTQVGLTGSFYYTFASCDNLTSLGLTNLQTINGQEVMRSICQYCTSLQSTGLNNLITINGQMIFREAFQNCTSLTSTGLTSVQTIQGEQACQNSFKNCTSLTNAELNNLTTIIGGRIFDNTFNGCTQLQTVHFDKLSYVNHISWQIFDNTFNGCTALTDIYFPILQSKNTTGSAAFKDMLKGTSNVTVHFHKNEQSTIGSWESAQNGFGGTNTTVLFDLGITVTVSIPSGYTVYINGTDVTNEPTCDMYEGDNEIVSVSSDGKVGKYNFVATSSTTAFVFDPTQIVYNEITCTGNITGATYSARASTDWVTVNTTADANDKIYCSAGFNLVISGTATGYYADPVTTTSDTSGTATFTFDAATYDVYDTTNFLSSITGDTTYASVDSVNNQLLYHYPTSATWSGSVQIALNVPAGTTKIKIATRAYVSSEAGYDFGYLALGTARANPQPTYSQVKAGTIANGVYLFRQSGTTNTMTPVNYETTDTTQNVLTVGFAQDSSLQGTNTLYIEPITVIYLQ